MTGRPLKYSPERGGRVLEALRAGYSRKQAARYGLIAHSTFRRWLRLVPDFDMAVRQAEAVAEIAAVKCIMDAAEQGHWQASLWWLERRHPEDWAPLR